MTISQIALVLFLKGAVVATFAKLGWWPDWVQRAKDREDEKLVVRAYKQWRKDAGPEAAAKLRVALESRTKRPKSFWAIK